MATIDRPFGRYLEDFEVGDVYRHWPGKTITEYDDHLFCMITMNHHPLHTNTWYAENDTVQKQNVVVGNLVYSLVLGMSVPDVSGAAVANLEVETLKHAKPTFHGDTIYAVTKVLDKKETSDGKRGIVTVETKGINQREEEVCFFTPPRHGVEARVRPRPPLPLRRRRLRRRVAGRDPTCLQLVCSGHARADPADAAPGLRPRTPTPTRRPGRRTRPRPWPTSSATAASGPAAGCSTWPPAPAS